MIRNQLNESIDISKIETIQASKQGCKQPDKN